MKCLVIVHDAARAVLCSLSGKMQNMNQITGNPECISLLPPKTSTDISSPVKHTTIILISLDRR
jgi:hypothetical protein